MAEKKLSPLLLLPPVIFAALAALFLFGMERDDPNALPSTMIGRPAPAMTLTPLGQEKSFTDGDLRGGGVKLVNFWASWCAPCRQEHPVLEKLAAEGVTIYGINYKDKPEKALRFLGELGDPYTAIATDPDGRAAIDWGVYGVPETFVVDGDGIIRLRHPGPLTEDIFVKQIEPLLK